MRTILLIEDNQDNQVIVQTILEHFKFEVLMARDGLHGIRLASERLPDLILMDLSLPLVDGWEATRTLKGAEETRHIPIIAITAHVLDGDRERAMEAGCDAYIPKPISPRLLVSTVQQFLGESDEDVA